ncbi:hypothetical protein Q5530_28970 [Saccharothrix sp. BKS2]|uniref:hypothetical protein n=1 Tax=Saccharothrix sp. BKS2 TaxID=3064400 RepID=UPI0039E78BD6
MEVRAAVADACARLAGRLSDDALATVRGHFAAGERESAGSALALGLARQGVGITGGERESLRSFLGDADLLDVPAVEEAPSVPYRFGPTAPADAVDPGRADILLLTNARYHGGLCLHRAWREPLEGARDTATWVYLLRVVADTDEVTACSGLASRLRTVLGEEHALEVVAEDRPLPPYQAAALDRAHLVWTA